MIEQEHWKGGRDTYKKHFGGSLAHKIEELYFIDLKYRALLLFVSSVRVTEAFKKQKVSVKKNGKKNEKIRKDEEQDDNAEVDDNEDDEVKAQDKLLLILKAETEMKELSTEETLHLLEKICSAVSYAPNNDMDVETVEKYLIFMALDLWAFGITGFENGEINRMMAVETARKEKISLVTLAEMMISLLEE